MNTSARNCIAVIFAALVGGLGAFLLSLFNVFNIELTTQLINAVFIIALVLYAIFLYALINAEKNRLVRDAVCCCGKLAIIGFVGTILTTALTLLLFGGAVRILFDLALGFLFFFLTLMLAALGCIITVLYQCRHNDC